MNLLVGPQPSGEISINTYFRVISFPFSRTGVFWVDSANGASLPHALEGPFAGVPFCSQFGAGGPAEVTLEVAYCYLCPNAVFFKDLEVALLMPYLAVLREKNLILSVIAMLLGVGGKGAGGLHPLERILPLPSTE